MSSLTNMTSFTTTCTGGSTPSSPISFSPIHLKINIPPNTSTGINALSPRAFLPNRDGGSWGDICDLSSDDEKLNTEVSSPHKNSKWCSSAAGSCGVDNCKEDSGVYPFCKAHAKSCFFCNRRFTGWVKIRGHVQRSRFCSNICFQDNKNERHIRWMNETDPCKESGCKNRTANGPRCRDCHKTWCQSKPKKPCSFRMNSMSCNVMTHFKFCEKHLKHVRVYKSSSSNSCEGWSSSKRYVGE